MATLSYRPGRSSFRRRRLTPVVWVMILSLFGVVPPPGPASASAGGPPLSAAPAETPVPPARFTGQRVVWGPCGGDFPAELRCATIDAPIDYRRPRDGALRVTFSKIDTSVPGKRRGVLLFNPGGPGSSGLDEPLVRRGALPRAVTDQYDLIGFDPRGVGRSTPFTCGLTGDETVQFSPYRRERFDHHVAVARSVAAKCADAGPTAAHISTRNTARDMDLFRALLREPKISYFGTSYGTYLGAVYTELFPTRTDRVVLDSNIAPARVWSGVLEEITAGGHRAWIRFTEWAAQRDDTYHLGRTPKAVERTFWELADRAGRDPLDIDGKRFGRFEARTTMAGAAMDSPETAVAYLRELRNALDGRPHTLVVRENSPGDDAFISLYWALFCNDTSTWPRGAQPYVTDVARNLRRYPLLGDVLTNVKPCAFWSLPRTEPDLVVDNRVPALLIQNEWDYATPGPMGQDMHRALRGSRLIMVEKAEEHEIFPDGSRCALDAVDAYLATGVLPARDITCPPATTPRHGE